MNKLPHEYLESEYKDDISIIFRVRDMYHWVTLRYIEGRIRYESSRVIRTKEGFEDEIRCAEYKLVKKIKESNGD